MKTTAKKNFKVVKRYPSGRVRTIFGVDHPSEIKGSSGRYVYEIYARAPKGNYRLAGRQSFKNHPSHIN